MDIDPVLIVALAGALELAARVGVLMVQKDRAQTRTLSYRAWILLVVFVPFAWAAWLLAGRAPRGGGQRPRGGGAKK